MPDIVYSTGPIEQEFGVDQLRLKVLNNSASEANAYIVIYDLNGTKEVFYTTNVTLEPSASTYLFVDLENLAEFEVQFTVSNPEVLVAVFAVDTSSDTFSAVNSVRHGEMVNITAGA